MGCGGSKSSEVASGNTLTARLLRRRSSASENLQENAVGDKGGRAVARESPDLYFSTRKDSMDVDAAGGYHTPLVELLVPHEEPALREKEVVEAAAAKVEAAAAADMQGTGATRHEIIVPEDASSKSPRLPASQVIVEEPKPTDATEENGDNEDAKLVGDSKKEA